MSTTTEQAVARLEVRAGECERRLTRLEDQELAGKLQVMNEKLDQLVAELADVHAENIWMKRAFVGAMLTLLGGMVLFLLTTAGGGALG